MILTIKPSEYDVFIGVDVDHKSFATTYFTPDTLHGHSLKMPAKPENIHHYFQKRFPGKRLLYAYEAGPTGYGLHDYIVSQGQSCMMVHPAGVPMSPNSRVKTNRIDSHKIGEEAKSGNLKGIRVPSVAYRELRHLVTLRQQYAQDLRATKQRIRALLLFENIQLPGSPKPWTSRYRFALHQVPLKETLRFKLDLLLKDLDHARDRILLMHRQTRKFCVGQEAIAKNLALLRSIPGIGIVVSSYLLARIADPACLQNVRELGAFCGLVPSEKSTGDKIHRGPITHMGDSTLRSLLVEAAWIAIRKDTELGEFYYRIRAKHKVQAGSLIAIVAVARKLTHRIYRVLKEQRSYVIH
jgi:transposase